jgi:hypothetical protein
MGYQNSCDVSVLRCDINTTSADFPTRVHGIPTLSYLHISHTYICNYTQGSKRIIPKSKKQGVRSKLTATSLLLCDDINQILICP